MNDLRNENTEYKHKISSHNMANQKLNMAEEELRIKIEELMNKTTELNFLLRQKEEEVQSANRKCNMAQIELNNARNVENSLNVEITEIQKTRDKINSEYEVLKEEHCQLQVDFRKQKYVLVYS